MISGPSIEDLVIPMILPAHVGTKRFFSEAQRSGLLTFDTFSRAAILACLSFFRTLFLSFFPACFLCPFVPLFLSLSFFLFFALFYPFSPLFLSLLTPFFFLTKFSVSPSCPCLFTSPKSLVASLPLPNLIRRHDIRANL